jgi:hypothetical protein
MSIYLFGEKAKAVTARSRSEDILQANVPMTPRRATSDPHTFICYYHYCYFSIDGAGVEQRIRPANSDSGQIQMPYST